MLLIIDPLAFVLASVEILEHAMSVCLVVSKLPHIIFAVGKDFPAITMLLVISKLTLILSAIRPKHDANSILHSILFQPAAG
jgi:hypothetical protein